MNQDQSIVLREHYVIRLEEITTAFKRSKIFLSSTKWGLKTLTKVTKHVN